MSATHDQLDLETHYHTLRYGLRLLLAVTEPSDDLDETRVAALSWLADKMDNAQRALWAAFEADLAEQREARR